MSVRIIKGDLLKAKVDLIVHGVNAKGKFASGIAGQIRARWPNTYEDYMSKYKTEGWHLGDTQYVKIIEPYCRVKHVVNCCTQKEYGYDNEIYADYNAIKECLEQVFRFAARERYKVGLPQIGCGLGGLNWTQVYATIFKLSQLYPDVDIEVYEL